VITPGGSDLWADYDAVLGLPHSDERTGQLEEIVWRADVHDVPRLTFLGRQALAEAHRADGRWDLIWPLLATCLDEHRHRPERFVEDEANLLGWYAWLVSCMVDFPDRSLDEIHSALADLERRTGRTVHMVRREIAVHVGDWAQAEEELRHQERDEWWDLYRIEILLGHGDDEEAVRIAAPLLDDPDVFDERLVRLRSMMLLPLARQQKWDEAVVTYRRLVRGLAEVEGWLEDFGRMAGFCALTGNLSEGTQWWVAEFEARRRPFATIEYAASAAVLARRLGWDVEPQLRALATDLAARFDARNGTSTCGDRIRATLNTEPLSDFLPIYPWNLPPIPTPPPGLGDEELLDRVELHDLRCEPHEAHACLAQVQDDLPQPLQARRDEMGARFFQTDETPDIIRRAIRTYLQHGDRRRAELSRCWLGLWVAHDDADEGVETVEQAVRALHTIGEGQAWGEYWLAYTLNSLGRRLEAAHAVARGKRHADDPLVLGSLQMLEATLTGAAPYEAYETFTRGGIPEKAREALYQLPEAAELDLNDVVGHAQLRGTVTGEHWYRLMEVNFAAERYEDAIDAGLRAAPWLEEAWHLIAECYRRSGAQN
jgi:hypothetical protein